MGAPGRSASAQHPWLPEGSPHTPPEYLALPRPGPQHPLASVPSLSLEMPRSASAPAKTLPKSHVVRATAHTLVSRSCPPGSLSYGCSLPPPMATSPARMQGPAHSTPTPSPCLCPGLPRAEARSALGVRLVPPSRGGRSRWGPTGGMKTQGPPSKDHHQGLNREPWCTGRGGGGQEPTQPSRAGGGMGRVVSQELPSSQGGRETARGQE